MEAAQREARAILAAGAPVDMTRLRQAVGRVVDFRATDNEQRTLLVCAVLSGDVAAVELVHAMGFAAEPRDCSEVPSLDPTDDFTAVERRLRRLSIRLGDPMQPDRSGMTALDHARQGFGDKLLAALTGERMQMGAEGVESTRPAQAVELIEVSLCGMVRVESCGTISSEYAAELESDPDDFEFDEYQDIYFLEALLLDQGAERNGTIRVARNTGHDGDQQSETLHELRLIDNEPELLETWCVVLDEAPPRNHCGIYAPLVLQAIENETFDQPFFRRGGLYTGCIVATFRVPEPFDPARLVLSRFVFPLMDVEGVCVDSYRLMDGTVIEPDRVVGSLEPWLIDSAYELNS